ncbi:class I SAM-dependent methyltransferase [Tardiphaga sp. 803_E3_N1_3]|uniref:class I SAM-dependent methyltransferase n=1 Tax=Tardiphaga sp. 803_E3_N1_3 TaxID=3240785 RepID=UPI003F264A43
MFKLTSEDVSVLPAPQLPPGFLWEYFRDGRTPARALTDVAMRDYIRAIEGSGQIIELGAAGDYYKLFASKAQQYLTSNLVKGGADIELDMTAIDLQTDTVDAVVSIFALEHIFEYKAAIDEQFRVLKPGGRMLLIVPFMYYYHAAPDDFFRFSASALDRLLGQFKVLIRQPLGGRWLLFSEFLHEKRIMGSSKNVLVRFLLRCLALPFLARALNEHDARYAVAFAYICEKEQSR